MHVQGDRTGNGGQNPASPLARSLKPRRAWRRCLTALFAWVAVTVLLGPSLTTAAQLTLTWVDASGGVAAFNIERKTGTAGTYATIAQQQEAGAVSYIDSTVTSGTSYCYRVQAVSSTGMSGYSNEACATAAAPARRLPDVNGDGNADILWRHSSGALDVWFMNGASLIGQSRLGSLPSDWILQGIGDLNGDGNADILWRHSSGLLHLWLMNDGSLIGQSPLGSVTSDWTLPGIGDFNGDGKADILWRHWSGDLDVWFMNGASIIASARPGSVAADWTIQGVGDFNNDRRADILWRHSSGAVYIWLTDGATVAGSGSLGSIETDWSVD
jgi:FG-GAP-like repeat